jgi:histone H4
MAPQHTRTNSTGRRGGKVFSNANRISIGDTLGLSRIQPRRVRRSNKIQKDAIESITTGDIRRLARRGGVKRIRRDIYYETRKVLTKFLSDVSHLELVGLIIYRC